MKKIRGFGGRSYGAKGDKTLQNLEKIQQQMWENLQKLEETFETMEVIGSAGGGAVKVRAKCNYEIVAIEYDDALLQDKEMLNDLIVAAVNEALKEIERRRQEEIEKITGIQGMPNL
ncbi:YbaB/EbfC family nucleoid-associated protein [Pseudothermotoga thermarum]|uniref:Nucleoid-associated protein Theth_0584 n=1 Tax=Pseudothermotoga thermarum DSM 5069 TaxID=688269 RepID=F7YXM9_9THEM|nr:YbaB/EbfC family nucleoid-associated protein [Pseudothermotoga thermarum]AEH50672.1 Uncharacterized protein family UPF0133 [Pseudothermotoga thermarum DSM 5069]